MERVFLSMEAYFSPFPRGRVFRRVEQSAAVSSSSAGGGEALGESGEAEEGLGGVPVGARDGGRRGVADAVEVAVGGEMVDAATEGKESEVGFETALEAGEGGVVGEERAEGAAGAGELAAQG
jgi:hypothetical protein